MKKSTSTLLTVVALITGAVFPAHAQRQAATPRIGILSGGTSPNPNLDKFIHKLRELGHIEGKNIVIEYRYAEGKADRLPELAAELVQLKVDAIFAAGPPAMLALKQATKTIPVVFFSTSDPIGLDVVASLARPGGNFTGMSAFGFGSMAQTVRDLEGNLSSTRQGCHGLE